MTNEQLRLIATLGANLSEGLEIVARLKETNCDPEAKPDPAAVTRGGDDKKDGPGPIRPG